MIEKQKEENEMSIKKLRDEINSKFAIFEKFREVYEKEMQQIKNKQNNFTELLYNLNATRFNFAMPIGFNKPIDGAIHFEENDPKNELSNMIIDALSLKIDDIEEKIVCVEQAIINIAEYVQTNTIISDAKELNKKESNITNELIDDEIIDSTTFKNAIGCLQDEINKINIAILSDEESMRKMNQQIHVLSTKFIEFNAKIIKHIHDYNRSKNQTIIVDQIVDKDALPFIDVSQQKQSCENYFCFKNSATNRFINKCNYRLNSESIIARIEFATVNNLSIFTQKLKKEFERRMGSNAIRSITIKKCKIHDNLVHRIDAVITFHSAVNHGYLNEIAFPTNWSFFAHTKQQSISKYPVNHGFIRTNKLSRDVYINRNRYSTNVKY